MFLLVAENALRIKRIEKLTHHYNDSISCVEVLPEYLSKGIKMAKKYHCELRITADFAGFFVQFEATTEKVILDSCHLNNLEDISVLKELQNKHIINHLVLPQKFW
ncbi:hypothetical protein [Capnocytophaga cynodegmi]|uniref:hypothetical protein n=1 Tax=Capnocytophaga cynodegmi TaxID=28189 RepID=UPI0038580E3F